MGEVVEAPFVTRLDVPVERILRQATAADLEHVIVIGWTKDGEMYFAGSQAGGPETLWLIELAKRDLLEIGAGVEG